MKEIIIKELEESIEVKKAIAGQLTENILDAAKKVIASYRTGGKVLLIGNGGSAADAQHIATELIGRFRMERKALPALALTTDSSVLTALANDYGYDTVFSRQLEALGKTGDVLIAITTSGMSPNIDRAIDTAHSIGMTVITLTGEGGGNVSNKADIAIEVPSANTQRVQEAHITIGHIICHLVEKELFDK
jgi:D-sedoheptulose 7-phosphate isomerase